MFYQNLTENLCAGIYLYFLTLWGPDDQIHSYYSETSYLTMPKLCNF